jgi:hypothetical protein
MLVPWSNNSTWNDVGSPNDGVNPAAGDAVVAPEATFTTGSVDGTTGEFREINLTASVQFWATNGGPNYGWALIDSGDDGYQFNSSEAIDVTMRPQLVVTYTASGATNPIVIVSQPPASITTNERANVTFAVVVTGTLPTYQWYKDDGVISGQTGPSYTITGATAADSGKYYCKITGLANNAQTADSMLTVVPDLTAPVVVSAHGGRPTNTTILVVFSEPMNQVLAETVSNYELLGPGGITIQTAALAGVNVTLTLSGPRVAGYNYQLRVKDLTDVAVSANVIDPNPTTLAVSTVVPVIAIETHPWNYLQQTASGVPAPCLDGTPWTEPTYDDGAWATGLGVFYGVRGPVQPVTTTATLDGSLVQTYLNVFTNAVVANEVQETNFYFRTTFQLSAESTNGASLLWHGMVDDGAVIYLNGNRIADVGFTTDPAYCTNFSTAGGSQTWTPALAAAGRVIGITGLVPGVNTLAVQVAQNNGTSSDITLGVLLEADVPVLLPTLHYEYGAGTLTLIWNAAGFVLQEADSVDGPWGPSSVVSGVPFAFGPGNKFYRLKK